MITAIVYAIIGLIVFKIYRYVTLPKAVKGVIRTQSGYEYVSTLGGNIDGRSGVIVDLPYVLPHIYLDSISQSLFKGPTVTYHNDQRVQLEGNFNKNFQLFVPIGYHVLALSILTPDVMESLMHTSKQFNVEIHDRQLSIFYDRLTHFDAKDAEELVAAAEAITNEIDQKLASWTLQDEALAKGAELTSYDQESVRISGSYYGIGLIAITFSTIVGLVLYGLAFYLRDQEAAEPFVLLGLAILAFPVCPLLIKRAL